MQKSGRKKVINIKAKINTVEIKLLWRGFAKLSKLFEKINIIDKAPVRLIKK